MSGARLLFLAALGIWVGQIVFFSFLVAPTVFQTLGPEAGGRVIASLLPRYYVVGLGAGAVAMLSALRLRRSASRPRVWAGVIAALAVGLTATAWAAGVVHPRASVLRPGLHADPPDPAAVAAFDAAHRLSVTLNGITLLGGVAALGLTAHALRH